MSRVLETALALKPVQSFAFFIKFRTPSVEIDAIINNLNLIGYDLVLIDLIGTFLVLSKTARITIFRRLHWVRELFHDPALFSCLTFVLPKLLVRVSQINHWMTLGHLKLHQQFTPARDNKKTGAGESRKKWARY